MISEEDYMSANNEWLLLNAFFEGTYIVDTEGKITFWNPGAKRLTGYSSDEMVGLSFSEDTLNLIDETGKMLCFEGCPIDLCLTDGKQREIEAYAQHKRGHRVPLRIRVTSLKNIPEFEAAHSGVLVTMTPAIESFKGSDRINTESQQQLIDPLTELPNRTFIEINFEEKMKMFEKFAYHFGVAIVDIDNFEAVKATYGRELSDEVLGVLARTFRNSFRGLDFIGRWQNDEFIFFFSGVTNDHMQKLCERIRILAEGSVLRNDKYKDIEFTVSVGGTVIRKGDTSETILVRLSDRLKRAKSKGGNTCITR